MDIHSASHYMRHGYRIRRAAWAPDEHVSTACYSNVVEMNRRAYYVNSSAYHVRPWVPTIDDLLANDWELTNDRIIGHFPRVEYHH